MRKRGGEECGDGRGWITGKAKLLSQLGSDLGGILLIGINQVGAEGAIGLAARIVLRAFIASLGCGPRCPSLLGGSLVVEGRPLSGVDLSSRGQQVLHNHKVTFLGGHPQGSALVILWLVGINSGSANSSETTSE